MTRPPWAGLIVDVPAPRSGYVEAIDAREVGLAAVALPARREKKGDPIRQAVGVVLRKEVGDQAKCVSPC